MERNPIRYVWRNSRLLHLGAALILLVLLPINWLALALPQAIVDNAVLGRIFANAKIAPFLPLILDLPYPLLDEPIVVFKGLAVERDQYLIYGAVALVLLLLSRALLLTAVAMMRTLLSRRLGTQLRLTLFRRLLAARGSGRDDATTASDLAGPGIASIGPFLGDALIIPALSFGQLAVILAFATWVSPWFGALLLAIAVLNGLSNAWVGAAEDVRTGGRVARERDVARAMREAVGRSQAIRIHGTLAAEEGVFQATLARLTAVSASFARRHALATMVRGFMRELGSIAVLGFGCHAVLKGELTMGSLLALIFAAVLVPRPIAALVAWRRDREEARLVFQDMARITGALAARERRDGKTAGTLKTTGPLVAEGLAALDPVTGVRIAGIDGRLDLPAHIALVGDATSGAGTFARLLGGGIEPSAGRITLAGTDLAAISAVSRAGRIAYAGGAPVILAGSVRDNLLYGSPQRRDDKDLIASLTLAGIDDEVYALGLAGTIDGAAGTSVGDAVVAARHAVRQALAQRGSAALVDPFDPETYNSHATVAENLMFGVPVGDTFRETNLARHPFVRAMLEAEDLTGYLEDKGLEIARSMVEIFEGVPDGHPLFERFSFFSAGERGAYEDLLARQAQSERRRGPTMARDKELLLALAFRYVETRHRLGLLDDTLMQRIVKARATFRSLLPASLVPSVEFYDPDRVCSAASLADNLLFGRVAHDIAGAADRVQEIVREVLAERGLDHLVFEIGLSARITEREQKTLEGHSIALDIARCDVRRPDILIVGQAIEGLGEADADALLKRLHTTYLDRTLVAVLPDEGHLANFSTVLRFDRGALVRGGDEAV